jgi:hypothetical protein
MVATVPSRFVIVALMSAVFAMTVPMLVFKVAVSRFLQLEQMLQFALPLQQLKQVPK